MSNTNRRQFICMAIGAGSAVGLGAAGWWMQRASLADAEAGLADQPWQPVTRTSWALGSEVSFTVLHPRSDVADAAITAALGELELVEELMSIYRPNSQLCRLNREGVIDDAHPYLLQVLQYAQSISRRTEGAFDITVQPLWALYAAAQKAGQLPDPAAIAATRKTINWRRVEITPPRVQLHGSRAEVTLNGIAQGFAADRAMAALRQHGVQQALVNTGEIGCLGQKSPGDPWTVGIQHPRRADAFISLARLDGRCLATSGDYATSFSHDHRYNHLFDPRTGDSPQELASVSIAARTAMQADALSTAVFVLGAEKGLQLIQSTPQADGFLVLKDGSVLATDGFPQIV